MLQVLINFKEDIVDKIPKIKIEDQDRQEMQDQELEDAITPGKALRALLYLTGLVILGFLILYGADKYGDYSEARNVQTIVQKINESFSDERPIAASILESYEFDLLKYREDNFRNDKLVAEINATLRKLQSQPASVQTGVNIKSWATAKLVKTDIDTVVVPYSDRSKYFVRDVFQPATPTEARAFEIYKDHPEWSKEVCIKIAEKQIWAGMTRVQLLLSWGQPRKIDKDFTYNRNTEQWVYGNLGPFVYLENNIVTSWQQ